MQTAGLILDMYDHPPMLREVYASVDDVPAQVKLAHRLTPDELSALPDNAFALVLMNDGERLRKFACVDEGGTRLNVDCFLATRHKLPEEAQKVAAANLMVACGWYNMDVPKELEKIALGLNTALTLATAPSLLKGTGKQISGNLAATRALKGQVVPLHQQAALGSMLKSAEASGTSLMPNQDAGDLEGAVARGKPGSSNTSAQKSAAIGRLVSNHRGEEGVQPEVAAGVAGTQYESAPQTPTRVMRPHVDVSNKRPPAVVEKKVASYHAYAGLFPLDNYAQVQAAAGYFDANMRAMPPEMRHEFASGLSKRAASMGIPISKEAAAYGSDTFASDEHLRAALDIRRQHITKEASAILDMVYEQRLSVGPDGYCALLEEFDKLAEIDHRYDAAIPDPYASTYGVKEAAGADTWVYGNDYVTREQIDNFAVTAALGLRDDYGDDFVKEFQRSPWSVFSSLPLPQKQRLARRASDNSATGMRDVR